MTGRERTPLLNMLRKLAVTSCSDDGRRGSRMEMNLSSIQFCDPIEVIINIEELAEVVNEIGQVRLRIAPSVFCKAFFPSTTIYIRDARSLQELIELFADASGLNLSIDDSGSIELYRFTYHDCQNHRATNLNALAIGRESETPITIQ